MGYFDNVKNKTPEPGHLSVVPTKPANPESVHRYASAALRDEARIVAEAAEGARNHTLNKAYFNMGRHVAAGSIDAETVRSALADAARASGLPQHEIEVVLREGSTSAMNASADLPRHPSSLSEVPVPVVLTGIAEGLGEDIGPPLNPIIDWHELFTSDDEEEEWIIEPILPARRMVALYSAPKAGKSLLMLELAVAMARGIEALGGRVERPYRVLYVDFENDKRGDIRPRLEAMGEADANHLGNLCYLSFPSLAKFDTAQGAIDLMRHVEHYDCEVVVIDTVSRAVAGEENENDTWLSFYRHTGLSLKRAGVACIRLDHSGKDKEKGMRGGSAKYGDVDAVWRLTAINENTINLECTDHRMPVPVKSLTLVRQDFPLRHLPAGDSWQVVADAKTRAMIERLDQLMVPNQTGVQPCSKALREAGEKVENRAIREAVKLRKLRLDEPLAGVGTGVPGTPPAHPGTPGVSVPGTPPPLGGVRHTPATVPGTPFPDDSLDDQNEQDDLVSCKRCSRHTTNGVASKNDGLCASCAHAAGMEGS